MNLGLLNLIFNFLFIYLCIHFYLNQNIVELYSQLFFEYITRIVLLFYSHYLKCVFQSFWGFLF